MWGEFCNHYPLVNEFKGMKLRITVYKESGKYYTHEDVECEKDIPSWGKEFKSFIRENLPAKLSEGYVVVEDRSDNQSFHQALYKYENLF